MSPDTVAHFAKSGPPCQAAFCCQYMFLFCVCFCSIRYSSYLIVFRGRSAFHSSCLSTHDSLRLGLASIQLLQPPVLRRPNCPASSFSGPSLPGRFESSSSRKARLGVSGGPQPSRCLAAALNGSIRAPTQRI